MNLQDPRHPWSRLVVAAREVRDERDASAPYGFATRVAALAFSQEQKVASFMERFALRAVGVSCLLALASVAFNYGALTNPAPAATAVAASAPTESTVIIPPAHDALAIVLDFAE